MINKLFGLSFLMATLVSPVMACEVEGVGLAVFTAGGVCEVGSEIVEGVGSEKSETGEVIESEATVEPVSLQNTEKTAKRVVLGVFTSSCPFCVQGKPDFQELGAEMAKTHHLVGGNFDDPDFVNQARIRLLELGIDISAGVPASLVPAYVFFKNGQFKNTLEAPVNKGDLKKVIEILLPSDETVAQEPASTLGCCGVGE